MAQAFWGRERERHDLYGYLGNHLGYLFAPQADHEYKAKLLANPSPLPPALEIKNKEKTPDRLKQTVKGFSLN